MQPSGAIEKTELLRRRFQRINNLCFREFRGPGAFRGFPNSLSYTLVNRVSFLFVDIYRFFYCQAGFTAYQIFTYRARAT
jgi:hypothetical protein